MTSPEPSKRRGRPFLPPGERRRNIGLQLSAVERDKLQRAADLLGVGLSVFIRQTAVKAAERALKQAANNAETA